MPEPAACRSPQALAARLASARHHSPSEASDMAQSTGSSGAGSGSTHVEKSSPSAWSSVARATAALPVRPKTGASMLRSMSSRRRSHRGRSGEE